MHDLPKRPQWNHTEVKTAAAETIFEDVKEWAVSMGAVPSEMDEEGERMLRALLTLAVLESADAYEAGRYLETTYGWPTTGELIRIIDRAYIAMPNCVTPFVHAWVMENNVRFPAKDGDEFKFRVGDLEVTGVCVGVVRREARGFAEVRGGKTIPVMAEDVVKVFKTKRPTGTPPTGGTPMASRAGAQLREKKA